MIARRARYTRIREITHELLVRFGVSGPAVAVADMVAGNDITVRYGDLHDVSGLIARDGRTTVIGINVKQPPTRQRFTMAHEFGHYILHQDLRSHTDTNFRVRYRDRTSSEATDIEEIEANFFAASLLMPKLFLDNDQAWEALGDDDEVKRLADIYEVSSHAMSLRLSNEYAQQRPY